MANLPSSGQNDSMDNTSVTRNEFRTGMGNMLSYLAKALGNEDSYTTQTVSPEAVKLNGTPTAPTPNPGDNSTAIATTAFVTAAVAASPGPGPGDGSLGDLGNVVAGGYIRADGTFNASKCLNIDSVVENGGKGRWTVNFTDPISTTESIVLMQVVPNKSISSGSGAHGIVNIVRLDSFDVTIKSDSSYEYYDFSFMVIDPTGSTREGSPFALTPDSIWGVFDGNGNKKAGNGYQVSKANSGQYQITFDAPLPDTNYAVVQGLGHNSGTTHSIRIDNTSKTVDGFAIRTGATTSNSFQDKQEIYFYVLHESMVGAGGGGLIDAEITDTVTGIPADATKITLFISNVTSIESGNKINIQVGDDNGLVTSGYQSSSSNASGGGTVHSTTSFNVMKNAANESVFTMNLTKISDDRWQEDHNGVFNLGGGNAAVHGSGYITGLSSITQIKMGVTGRIAVTYEGSGGGSGGSSSTIPVVDPDTVGSFAFLGLVTEGDIVQMGDERDASVLKPQGSGGWGEQATGSVTGTWRALGYASHTSQISGSYRSTLFQKISDTTRSAEVIESIKAKARERVKEMKEGHEPSASTMPVPEEELEAGTMPAPEAKRTRKRKAQ